MSPEIKVCLPDVGQILRESQEERRNLARDVQISSPEWDDRVEKLVMSLASLLEKDADTVASAAKELGLLCGTSRSSHKSYTLASILENYIDEVGSRIPDSDPKTAGNLLSVCSFARVYGPTESTESAEIVAKNIETVKAGINDENLRKNYLEVAAQVLNPGRNYEGCDEARREIENCIQELINSDEVTTSQKISILSALFRFGYEGGIETRRLLNSFLVPYGLNGKKLDWSWAKNEDVDDIEEGEDYGAAMENAVTGHLASIVELEAKAPGICRELNANFGIRNFRLYPQDLLLKQYEEIENFEKPYVAVISAIYGAPDLKKWLSEFRSEVPEGYLIRVIEVADSYEAGRIVINAKKYPKKAELVIMVSHGWHFINTSDGFAVESYLNIGGGTTDVATNPGKVDKRYSKLAGKAIQGLCSPSAPIVMAACHIGERRGVIQKFSQECENDFWGSADTVCMSDFTVGIEPGVTPIEIKPDLGAGMVLYRNGEAIDWQNTH